MNPLQKAALRRKVCYIGLIVVLFTVSMFWRGTIPIPLSSSVQAGDSPDRIHRYANQLANLTIKNQASALDVWELDQQQEVDLAGSTAMVGTLGLRGYVVAYLWMSAIAQQKRNDFHEFEVTVRSVTSLQPHFTIAWEYQSWNIAYNVSVELKHPADMYFYIARGIELLAEGGRRNKRSPDMRHSLGFYYMNKFGVSDDVQVLRCLFQLSCIPPGERNPSVLIDPDTREENPNAFRTFCENNPHLIRRLQEKLNCRTPMDVIAFVRDNQSVPSRYRNSKDLADDDKQFPILPQRFEGGKDEVNSKTPYQPKVDTLTGFRAARAWYTYANTLAPTFPTDSNGNPVPGPSPQDFDHARYTLPRRPMLILFRQDPALAQSKQAELEQKEGWFDSSGWSPNAQADANHPFIYRLERNSGGVGTKHPLDVKIGQERSWSGDEWRTAAAMWQEYGESTGLILGPRLNSLKEEVGDVRTLPPEPSPDQLKDAVIRQRYEAQKALYYYQSNRSVTNFPYHLASAQAEARERKGKFVTVEARKMLWEADQARKAGNKLKALELYDGEPRDKSHEPGKRHEGGLQMWKQVLLDNPEFYRPENGTRTEEQTYEFELAYLRLLVTDDPRVRQQARLIGAAAPAIIPFAPAAPWGADEPTVRTKANQLSRGVAAVVPFIGVPYHTTDPAVPDETAANQSWNPRVLQWVTDQARAVYTADSPFWKPDAKFEVELSVAESMSPFAGTIPLDTQSPYRGEPWVRNSVKDVVRSREGLKRKSIPPPEVPDTVQDDKKSNKPPKKRKTGV